MVSRDTEDSSLGDKDHSNSEGDLQSFLEADPYIAPASSIRDTDLAKQALLREAELIDKERFHTAILAVETFPDIGAIAKKVRLASVPVTKEGRRSDVDISLRKEKNPSDRLAFKYTFFHGVDVDHRSSTRVFRNAGEKVLEIYSDDADFLLVFIGQSWQIDPRYKIQIQALSGDNERATFLVNLANAAFPNGRFIGVKDETITLEPFEERSLRTSGALDQIIIEDPEATMKYLLYFHPSSHSFGLRLLTLNFYNEMGEKGLEYLLELNENEWVFSTPGVQPLLKQKIIRLAQKHFPNGYAPEFDGGKKK